MCQIIGDEKDCESATFTSKPPIVNIPNACAPVYKLSDCYPRDTKAGDFPLDREPGAKPEPNPNLFPSPSNHKN